MKGIMNGGDDHEGNTMDDEMSLEQTGGFVVTNTSDIHTIEDLKKTEKCKSYQNK